MTKLDDFLDKDKEKHVLKDMETASGSFACQTNGCTNIAYEAQINHDKGRLFWYCEDGHESSIRI